MVPFNLLIVIYKQKIGRPSANSRGVIASRICDRSTFLVLGLYRPVLHRVQSYRRRLAPSRVQSCCQVLVRTTQYWPCTEARSLTSMIPGNTYPEEDRHHPQNTTSLSTEYEHQRRVTRCTYALDVTNLNDASRVVHTHST